VKALTGARVFKRPAVVRFPCEAPAFRRGRPGQATRQDQPRGAGGRCSAAAAALAGGRRFKLPGVWCDAHDDQGPGGFGELEESVAVRAGSDEQISGEFGAFVRGVPDGLTTVEFPAGQGQIDWRQGRKGMACGEPGDDEQEEEKTYPVWWRLMHVARHGRWRRGDV
jgi:hypothetical protein